MSAEHNDPELISILHELHARSGYDFSGYSLSGIRRRLMRCCHMEQVPTIAELTALIARDDAVLTRVVREISVAATAMFRDPPFFRALREQVIPPIRREPTIRIWHAGCATGEEVLSLAIVLAEEGLLDRSRIYATDLNDTLLARARSGIFPVAPMRQYTAAYLSAGGKRAFSEYYAARYNSVLFDRSLYDRVLFSQHNLVTDGSFGAFHLILCRNVLIYFGRSLQNRVIGLLTESLDVGGVLGLGRSETLAHSGHEGSFELLVPDQKLYRKLKH